MTDLYDRRLHGVAVYNPDLLSKDELMAQFVVRRQLLDQLLGDLRRDGFNQHQIVVGHRGMGKTTLLRMIRFAVESDDRLSPTWLPLTFPEEQYNVSRLSDFYVNCADAMSDTLERMGRRAEADLLDAEIDSLPRDDEAKRTAEALALLRRMADRLRVKLLLLVDNFELITERLRKDEASLWALRELLSHEPWLLLIAASPVVMGAALTYDAPFYDFFQTHELRALTVDESKELLRVLAVERDEPQVAALVDSDPARIETLHTLAGGNPRTIVLLFGVLSQGADGDVRSDLERLLDICTPLYKARFEEMPAQAQQVVDALAIHWDPVSAGELAEQLRLDVNAVSSQLTRLAQQGIVEKVEYEPATKTGFQVAERFFNIWYLMRASRRLRKRLTWLVQFLKLFYGAEHLLSRASMQLQRRVGATSDSKLRDAEFCLALADALDDKIPLKTALEYRAVEALLSDRKFRTSLASIIDVDGDPGLVNALDRQQWARDFEEAVRTAELPREIDKERLLDLIGGSALARTAKSALAHAFARFSDEKRKIAIDALEALRSRTVTAYGSEVTETLRLARRKGYLDDFNAEELRVAGAMLNAPELIAVKDVDSLNEDSLRELAQSTESSYCWFQLGQKLVKKGSYPEAEDAYRRALDRDPWFGYARIQLANVIGVDRPADAEALLMPFMPSLEGVAAAHLVLGTLLYSQNRAAEAELSLRKAVELAPDHFTRGVLGLILAELKRFDEAIPLLEAGLLVAGKHSAIFWLELISAKREVAGVAEAARVARDAMAAFPTDADIHYCAARLMVINHDYLAAIEAATIAVTTDPTDWHLSMLATALVSAGRWQEAIEPVRHLLSGHNGNLDEDAWLDLRVLFGLIATQGFADEAGKIMDESDAGERLRPLREALRHFDRRHRGALRRLAPEVRTATRGILQWWDSQLYTALDLEPPSPPSTKPVHRKKRRT